MNAYEIAIQALQDIKNKSVHCDLYDLKDIANKALDEIGTKPDMIEAMQSAFDGEHIDDARSYLRPWVKEEIDERF